MISEAYLHIGQEKTGTTSIQDFLHANTQNLRADRVYVPGCLGHKNHKILAAYALDDDSHDIAARNSRPTGGPDKIAAFRARTEQALAREIKNSGATKAIFSSEDLSRLFTPHEVQRAVDLIRSFCPTFKVVVFARRQDLLASSRYYSLVLGGSQTAQVLPVKGRKSPPYYDYERNIGLWIDAVGAENVRMVRFPENPRAENFNSVNRFCETVGLDASHYGPVPRQHVSYDAVNQIIMQNFNVLKGGYDQAGLEHLMQQLTDTNDRQFNHIPSAGQARSFYDGYRDSNKALFQRLGAEDQMFTEDFSMYQEDNMRPVFQAKAIRRLLELLPGPKA